MAKRCMAVKSNGERCRQVVGESQDYCIWHDPERETEAARARGLGGALACHKRRTRRKTAKESEVPSGPPETAEEAKRFAAWATWAVATGAIDVEVGSKVGGLIATFLRALDKSEMEGQVAELRAKLQELQRREAVR